MLTTISFACMYLVAATSSGIADILSMAGELMTWVITQMTAILTFIQGNPIIMIFMIITLVGFCVGLLFRIWHSVS